MDFSKAFGAVLAVTAGTAMAGVVNPTEFTGVVHNPGHQSTQGADLVTVANGIGNTGGFALAATGLTDHTIGATDEVVGGGLVSGDIVVTSSMTHNGGGNYDIAITLYSSDGSDLFPSGFTVAGLAADTGGFFMGVNAGGDPINFSDVALTNSATIEIFDSAGPAGGPFDISGFANFSALGGGWDGSVGVSFGAGSAGAGINAVELLVNVTVVPAPAGLAGLALGGLVASRRRRA